MNGSASLTTSLLLNSNNNEIYSGHKGGLIEIWDLESSKVKHHLQGHSSVVTCLTLSKDLNSPYLLVSGALDGKIKVWDLRSKANPLNVKGHTDAVKALTVSPENSYVGSGSEDGIAKLWDIRKNVMVKEFRIDDQNAVNCVEFNPHSVTLAYGSNDKTCKHWDLERYDLISITAIDRLPIVKLQFDETGKNAFVATNEGFKYWMIDDSEPVLLDLMDIGWNKLNDMRYYAENGLYGKQIL